MPGPTIGLDIGTSAVRAAQIVSSRKGMALTSFGQVALPQGAVGDGEIRDHGAVSEAIAQLWKRAKLRPRRAVVGVANQRVLVRAVDMPYLEEKEFRASLRFQAADHIPMPVDEAELDFQMLDEYVTEGGERMMRVLLVAAASDMVESVLTAVSGARVEPLAVDLVPFAVARAISPAARGEEGLAGAEAIIDVGAGVSNVVIHHNGEPRFVRILLVGGDDLTEAIASEVSLSFEEAEAIKLDLTSSGATPEVQRVIQGQVATLVQEIQGSLDYYSSQEDSQPIASMLITGGGSLTPTLAARLEETSRVQVRRASPFADVDMSKSGLTPEQISQIEPVAACAVGLAMGVTAK